MIILVFLVLREACKLVLVFVVVVTVVDLDFANEEDDEEAIIVVREDADGRPAEEEEEEARINLDDGAQSMILFFFFEFVFARKVLCAQRQVASFLKEFLCFGNPKQRRKLSSPNSPSSSRLRNTAHTSSAYSHQHQFEKRSGSSNRRSFGGGAILSVFRALVPLKKG